MIDDISMAELRALIKTRVRQHGSISAYARELGVCDEQVSSFLRGSRPPEPKLLKALGLKRVVRYVKI